LPLIKEQELAIAALETFKTIYPQAFAERMSAKLGFAQPQEAHDTLVEDGLRLLAADRVDYTIFWRTLSHWATEHRLDDDSVRDLFLDRAGIDAWLLQYSEHLSQYPRRMAADLMLKTNPKYVLRNHLGEMAIQAAKTKNYAMVAQLLRVLENPFDEHPEFSEFAGFPPDWAGSIAISCSS
jgi:uncharacterized protein YdiU (UPF0061 family)